MELKPAIYLVECVRRVASTEKNKKNIGAKMKQWKMSTFM